MLTHQHYHKLAMEQAKESARIYKPEDYDDLREKALVTWRPQAGSQEDFLRFWHIFELLYEGTRGPGKTDALLMAFAMFVGQGWGQWWSGIIFRRTYAELSDIIAKSQRWFNTIYGSKATYTQPGKWTWDTGEILRFSYFDRPEVYWKHHGKEYPFIGWEELTTQPNLIGYKAMFSCCRSSVPDTVGPFRMPRMVRSTTNPYGVGHNQVKTRFRLPGMRGRIITDSVEPTTGMFEPPRLAIYGHIKENKILLKSEPDYIARVASAARNDAERAAWLDGDWDVTSGGMFDDIWDAKVHSVSAFEIPPGWRIDRSFDWGSSAPFSVGWWAESDGSDVLLANGKTRSTVRGDLFRIREWYGWNGKDNEGLQLTADEIAMGIVERELRWGLHGRVKTGIADSQIFSKSNDNCIADDMLKEVSVNGTKYKGIRWNPADKSPGSVAGGLEVIRQRLKNAFPKRTKEGKLLPREKPGLYCFREYCSDGYLRTLPPAPRSEKDPDKVFEGYEDHCIDEVRYRLGWKRPVVRQGTTS